MVILGTPRIRRGGLPAVTVLAVHQNEGNVIFTLSGKVTQPGDVNGCSMHNVDNGWLGMGDLVSVVGNVVTFELPDASLVYDQWRTAGVTGFSPSIANGTGAVIVDFVQVLIQDVTQFSADGTIRFDLASDAIDTGTFMASDIEVQGPDDSWVSLDGTIIDIGTSFFTLNVPDPALVYSHWRMSDGTSGAPEPVSGDFTFLLGVIQGIMADPGGGTAGGPINFE